jgi:DNA-binding transcriptional ArsR family regulator
MVSTEPVTELDRDLADERIAELADLFRLLGDGTRLRIVLSCLAAPANVGDIAARVGASPSLVSHHLRLLRAARLVRSERRGRQIFYSPRDEHVQCVIEDMVAHVTEPRDDLEGDA